MHHYFMKQSIFLFRIYAFVDTETVNIEEIIKAPTIALQNLSAVTV